MNQISEIDIYTFVIELKARNNADKIEQCGTVQSKKIREKLRQKTRKREMSKVKNLY